VRKLAVGRSRGKAQDRRLRPRRAHHDERQREQGHDRVERAGGRDVDPPDQELTRGERDEGADHVDREDPAARARRRLRVQPALGRDEEPGAAEADGRAQGQPTEGLDEQRHGRGRGGDQPGEGGVGANVADARDDPIRAHRAQREASEVAAQDQAGRRRREALDRHPERDEGPEEAVGELDDAGGDDQRPDRGPSRPARPHRSALLLPPAAANELVRPIHERMPLILSPTDFDAWPSQSLPETLLRSGACAVGACRS
jgi:hypothetical protein